VVQSQTLQSLFCGNSAEKRRTVRVPVKTIHWLPGNMEYCHHHSPPFVVPHTPQGLQHHQVSLSKVAGDPENTPLLHSSFNFLVVSCRSMTQGLQTARSSSSSISLSSTDGGRQTSFLAQQPVEEVMILT
jgi:hypothetical protein